MIPFRVYGKSRDRAGWVVAPVLWGCTWSERDFSRWREKGSSAEDRRRRRRQNRPRPSGRIAPLRFNRRMPANRRRS